MKSLNVNKITLVLLHGALGIVAAYSPLLLSVWIYVFFFYSIDRIVRYRNSDGWALYAAAYIVGMEIVFRLSNAYVFSEFGKYGSCTLLLLGMIIEKEKHQVWRAPLMYFILLMPSIIMMTGDISDIRINLSYNLSGPLTLAISTIYCYRRRITMPNLMRMFLFILFGLTVAVVIIVVRMPNLTKMGFNLSSNRMTSGGYGPNQVATALGLGFLLVGLAWVMRAKLTENPIFDRMLGFVMLSYAVLTFARGGVITAILSLGLGVYVFSVASGNIKQFFRVLQILVVALLVGTVLWVYLDSITHNFLAERYEKSVKKRVDTRTNEESQEGEGINADLSGREFIVAADFKIFARYPILGVGPGMARDYRQEYLENKIAAHTELTRLLAEHGLYGLAAGLLIIFMPFMFYKYCKTPEQKALLVTFVVFSISTTMHSAMRLSAPGFTYGIAFLNIISGNALEKDKNASGEEIA